MVIKLRVDSGGCNGGGSSNVKCGSDVAGVTNVLEAEAPEVGDMG